MRRSRDAEGRRVVPPYLHAFTAFAKQRWCGRKILDVFSTDFASHTPAYFEAAIRAGAITVSKGGPGKAASNPPLTVALDYVLRDGDYLIHRVHRHEPPVPGDAIDVLVAGDDSGADSSSGGGAAAEGTGYRVHAEGLPPGLVVLNKPAGMPVHSCGPYKYNTVLSCAVAELGMPLLSPAHRLDRVTSGILLLGRTAAAASTMSAWIRDKRLRKVYLARVEGHLQPPPSCESSPSVPMSEALIGQLLGGGSSSEGSVDAAAQGCALIDTVATAACPWLGSGITPRISWEDMLAAGGDEGGEGGAGGGEADAIQAAAAAAEAAAAPARVKVDSHTLGWTVPLAGVGAAPVAEAFPYPATGEVAAPVSRWLRVAVPTLATDPKGGRHGAAREGDALTGIKTSESRREKDGPKASVTLFRPFAWGADAAGRPYTVVEAVPLSGRTHQLRVHLAWLGHAIANDPMYSQAAAQELLAAVAKADAAARTEEAATEADGAAAPAALDSLLRSLCSYCTSGPSAEFSVYQRGCMGIWLHSIEYAGPGWRVATPVPSWAAGSPTFPAPAGN